MSTVPCGCCACLSGAGHVADIANRPGLSAIQYRVGAYGSFFDAMIRRLTVSFDDHSPQAPYPLRALRTRESDDPAIAMLDAWAVVGDVLTFYQERIANEAFLRTATERRSVLELGRLVGYRLKPGVSASVYLAYTLDETATTVIPAGTKAQSIPGANEQPQMFETSEEIEARGAWNALPPRMSRPQDITIDNVMIIPSVWIDGTTTRFNVRDPLLFVFETSKKTSIYALRRTLTTNIDLERKRTEVVFEPVRPFYIELAQLVRSRLAETKGKKKKSATTTNQPSDAERLQNFLQHVLLGVPRHTLIEIADNEKLEIKEKIEGISDDDPKQQSPGPKPQFDKYLKTLIQPPGLAPATQWQVSRSLDQSLNQNSDFRARLLTAFYPQAEATLYAALANNASGAQPYAEFRSLHVLRRLAAPFGYNAPAMLFEDRPSDDKNQLPLPVFVPENIGIVRLDTPDEAITVGSYVIAQNKYGAFVSRVRETETQPYSAYGISGKTTRLALSGTWWREFPPQPSKGDKGEPPNKSDAIKAMVDNLEAIRNTSVLAESEELNLAQMPVDRPVGLPFGAGWPGGNPDAESQTRVALDRVYDGLTPGRWVIVTGERVDTSGTSGIVASELAMIDNVEQQTDAGPGGTAYSVLTLAPKGLAFQYKRATAKIAANVVKATNGETRSEILGAGDAGRPMQTFTLHHTPLTFVSAPTVSGVASTLAVRVSDVLWHEIDTLADAAPEDRIYVTKTADDGKVSISFGDGKAGSRLPTGPDNVRAVYRSDLGRGGNVRAGQVATAVSRPLGVRDVVNPLAAYGGADPESRDDARRNIPVSLQAMGRVVSISDYADFARTFAGISKATAAAISDKHRRLVLLTVGGAGDIEIDVTSDLYRNLGDSLRRYGDPYQPFLVLPREKIVIVGAAGVRIDPDYLWTSVAPDIRAALLDRFSYDRRDFAQPVYPAEVVATIQSVAGVVSVVLTALAGIRSSHLVNLSDAPTKARDAPRLPALDGVTPIIPRPGRRSRHQLRAAQIAYLPPELADLFILTEIIHD
jgi:hypothetical protein